MIVEAYIFIFHLIADSSQPLHSCTYNGDIYTSINGGDRGGNAYPLIHFDEKGELKQTRLHFYFDDAAGLLPFIPRTYNKGVYDIEKSETYKKLLLDINDEKLKLTDLEKNFDPNQDSNFYNLIKESHKICILIHMNLINLKYENHTMLGEYNVPIREITKEFNNQFQPIMLKQLAKATSQSAKLMIHLYNTLDKKLKRKNKLK
jgi:hypothetical protein